MFASLTNSENSSGGLSGHVPKCSHRRNLEFDDAAVLLILHVALARDERLKLVKLHFPTFGVKNSGKGFFGENFRVLPVDAEIGLKPAVTED